MEGEDVECQLSKMDQAFPLHFCILSLIKNWMVGRPGNKASVCAHNNCGCMDLLLMLVPLWDVLCNSGDVISSGSHYGILAASVDQHLMCLIDSY